LADLLTAHPNGRFYPHKKIVFYAKKILDLRKHLLYNMGMSNAKTTQSVNPVAPVQFDADNNRIYVSYETYKGIEKIVRSYTSAFNLLKCTANGKADLTNVEGFVHLFLTNGSDDLPIFEPFMADLTATIEKFLLSKLEGEVPENFEFGYRVGQEDEFGFNSIRSDFYLVRDTENRVRHQGLRI
jgi:hypothetical protein